MTNMGKRRGGYMDSKGRPEIVAASWVAKGAANWRGVETDEEKDQDGIADQAPASE